MVSARVFFVFLCLACADAARIQTESNHNIETEEHSRFGQSCETLHSRFRSRSNSLQNFVNSYAGSDDMSVASRARAMMKVTAVLRTLRRSSVCPWVDAGNSSDLEAIGDVLRKVLANNPCAPAALAELQLLDTGGQEGAAPLARAMAILMSDTCEYPQGQESDESNELVDDDAIVEREEMVQDVLEEMLEPNVSGSSLVEQSDMQRAHSWAYVGKLIGALMLGVLVVLGCGFVLAMVGTWVGIMFGIILGAMAGGELIWFVPRALEGATVVGAQAVAVVIGAGVGAGVGAISGAMACGHTFVGFMASLGQNASNQSLPQF